jgi:hypothetical protein
MPFLFLLSLATAVAPRSQLPPIRYEMGKKFPQTMMLVFEMKKQNLPGST